MEKDLLKTELNKLLSEEQIKAFGEIVIKAAKMIYDSIVKFVRERLFQFYDRNRKIIMKMENMENHKNKQLKRMQLYKRRRAKYGK